jgi:hypothetical protein
VHSIFEFVYILCVVQLVLIELGEPTCSYKIVAIRPFKSHEHKMSSLKRYSVEFEGTHRFDSSVEFPSIIDIQTFHCRALLYPLRKGMQEKLEGED